MPKENCWMMPSRASTISLKSTFPGSDTVGRVPFTVLTQATEDTIEKFVEKVLPGFITRNVIIWYGIAVASLPVKGSNVVKIRELLAGDIRKRKKFQSNDVLTVVDLNRKETIAVSKSFIYFLPGKANCTLPEVDCNDDEIVGYEFYV